MTDVITEFEASTIGQDPNAKQLLEYLLANASGEDKTVFFGLYTEIRIDLKCGQLFCSSRKLSVTMQFTRQELRTALKKLKFFGFIETEGSHYGTIITIKDFVPARSGLVSAPGTPPPTKNPAQKKQRTNMHEQKKMDIQEARKAASLIDPYPDDPQEVVKAAERIGYKMTADEAMLFIANYRATGWIAGNGQPIRRWKDLLYRWKNNSQASRFTSAGKNPVQKKYGSHKSEDYGSFRKDGK
jgi:hypothetical protein